MTSLHTSYESVSAAFQRVDPIQELVARRCAERDATLPILTKQDIAVTVRSGLAVVEMARTYTNQEKQAIEALLSFPVPVQAAFFGLTARVGDRVLHGKVMPQESARETYEDALDEGMMAVLHEELLRGVHLISVGNLGAGATVSITTRWALSLSFQEGYGLLRIPLTVGEVYGASPLPDSDALTYGGTPCKTRLQLSHDASAARLASGTLHPAEDGCLQADIAANAPVDLSFSGSDMTPLVGRENGGRQVTVSIEPVQSHESALNAVVLVDHSGSMHGLCAGGGASHLTMHEALVRALGQLPANLRNDDRIALWEFDHHCTPVGSGRPADPATLASLVPRLQDPAGGTEIGGALDTVQFVPVDDVLLITDGMSYALDIEKHAQSGRRISIVLVGEDSLEARVGHLAALTGGTIQFSFGSDVARALEACIAGMRMAHSMDTPFSTDSESRPSRIVAIRGNAQITATWTVDCSEVADRTFSEGIAAFAASLTLAHTPEEDAEKAALEAGLVTHLTSLVLVDAEGERQEGLPITRKVDLPTPGTRQAVHSYMQAPSLPAELAAPHSGPERAFSPHVQRRGVDPHLFYGSPTTQGPFSMADELHGLRLLIDWNAEARHLAAGSLDKTSPELSNAIRRLAAVERIAEEARELGMDSVRLVIALLAHLSAPHHRSAQRVLRRLLRGVDADRFQVVVDAVDSYC